MDAWGIGARPLCQLSILLPGFIGRPAGGIVVIEELPVKVAPLVLLP